ncbi:hypothetical protein C2G38_2208883 [Gigaspora rosea]|uniref:Uncharacterized protein n=1 Tax=Gigaspora rosea TaxID=44941 RepID=A0A397UH66_9GLOM|nr:hypothetical protein C2G38_2208883 [Gigaspora rosea]
MFICVIIIVYWIFFHIILIYSKNFVQEYLERDNLADIPYFIQFDRILFKSLQNLPLNRPNGEHLTFEQLVNELNKDTVSYEHTWGIRGFEGMICFSIKVEASRYATGIQWLRDLLWNTEFTAER